MAYLALWTATVIVGSFDGGGHHRGAWRFVVIGLIFLSLLGFATADVMTEALRRRGLWPSRPASLAPEPYTGSADKATIQEWLKRRAGR